MAERRRFQPDPQDIATRDLLDRIRARHGIRPLDAEDDRSFNAGWNAAHEDVDDYVEDLVREARSRATDETSRAFREQFPALARWRDRVLKHPRRMKPSEVAAAYECLALELTLAGEIELAAKAHTRARKAVGLSTTAAEARSA